MTKKILFRADGNSETGLGHIYRLIALVEMYKNYFDFIFVTKESSTKYILPQSYKVITIPDSIDVQNEPKWLQAKFNVLEYIIIADGYQFDGNYQKKIKEKGFKLMYIDDLVQYHMYADVVVNHAANILPEKYKKETYTTIAWGTDYAILRPSFIKAAQKHKPITKAITTAFVCFGGADALDLSFKATEALLQINQIKTIHVVLGAAYKHLEIFKIANQTQKIKIHRNLDEQQLCNLMEESQFAIAPSSTIAYELCSVKMPILSGYFVDNQKNSYEALLKQGTIYGGGDFINYTVQDFKVKAEQIINNTNQVSSYLKAQQNLFDGQSNQRFLMLLNNLLISFRKAEMEDMLLLYNWSNDSVVRQNSFNSQPIALETHQNWFQKKINDPQTLFLIALFGDEPAGTVRYEMENDHAVVGVLLAENFRGKKLSPSFLSESAKHYFKQNHLPIFAYIKEENIASIKAFENAGYSFYKKEIVKNNPSFVYKLEKKDVKG